MNTQQIIELNKIYVENLGYQNKKPEDLTKYMTRFTGVSGRKVEL